APHETALPTKYRSPRSASFTPTRSTASSSSVFSPTSVLSRHSTTSSRVDVARTSRPARAAHEAAMWSWRRATPARSAGTVTGMVSHPPRPVTKPVVPARARWGRIIFSARARRGPRRCRHGAAVLSGVPRRGRPSTAGGESWWRMNVFMAMGGRGTRGLRRRDPRGCAGSDLRPREGVEVARDLALERAAQRAERQPEVRRDADDVGGGGDGAADARALYAEDVAVPRRANVEAAAEGAGDGLGLAVSPRAAEHVAPADLD